MMIDKHDAAPPELHHPRHDIAGDVVRAQSVDDDDQVCVAWLRSHGARERKENGEPSKPAHMHSLDDPGNDQKMIDIDAMATASGTCDALGTSIMFVRTAPHPSD